jgi:type I restriction enzyme S subunit
MNWDEIKLGEVMDVKHGYAFKSEFFADSGEFVLLSPGNCYESGGLKLKGDKEKFYSGEFPREFLLAEGDMLVVMTDLINTAPILGGSFLIPESNRFLHNQRLGLVRVTDRSRIDKRFLYFLLNTHDYRGQVRGSASGATVRHTSPGRIKNCTVRIPRDVPCQRKIADILFAYDDLMENNRQRMALLEQAARELYRECFVRLRFPGHQRTRLKESSLGKIPSQWRVVCLGDITTKIGSGATPRGGEAAYQQAGIPLIRSLNVYDDRFQDDGLAFLSDEQADELSQVEVKPRDILLNITGASVARCCMAPGRHLPARVNQHVMIIRPDPEMADPCFVLAAINSQERKAQLLSLARAGGATREALTKDTIHGFQIVLPDATLLHRFAEFAGTIFQQREVLAHQNHHLRTARDLLLPRLMSGEIEV